MLMRGFAVRLELIPLLCLLAWATLLAGPPVLAQDPDEPDELSTYEVQDGDTLLGLAQRFGVPVEVLVALNNLEEPLGLILIGQQLLLPSFASQPNQESDQESVCATPHVVVAGETLWGLADDWDVTVERLRELNGLQAGELLLIGETVCGPPVNPDPQEIGADEQDNTEGPRRQPEFDPGWIVHPTESFWYTVNLGDTLAWVSARYGLTTETLADINALLPDDDIQPGQLLLVPASTAAGKPWTARYWAVPDLSGEPLLTRGEDAIAHNWGNSAPADSLPSDSFSAEWTGDFDFVGATYRFIGLADQGVRVFLNNDLLLDNWDGETAGPLAVDTVLEAGTHAVRVEYWEETGPAMVYVLWFQSVPATPE
ncbi:MAG: LysM peptidoglycan-binding domain-containing protein [Caldilineaceae bacterium]|nr:LysM peptidoglycan-binding domain-containing protein [Caldilineaceae bacterium]